MFYKLRFPFTPYGNPAKLKLTVAKIVHHLI